MTKANVKRAKKDIAVQIEKDANENGTHYGSSCDDMCYSIYCVRLNYGKPGVGCCTMVASGVTCKGTERYPNGSPFIDYNKVIFTYTVDPKNGDVNVTDWWVKFGY